MADVAGRWNWVSIAAAVLLACYLGLAIWALAAPSEYDPQQGKAIGFIIPVSLVLGGLLLFLWRAVVRDRRWLVWTIFVLAAYPAAMRAAQFVYSISSTRPDDRARGAENTSAATGNYQRVLAPLSKEPAYVLDPFVPTA